MKLFKMPRLKPREFKLVLVTVGVSFLLLNWLIVLPWKNRVQDGSEKLKKLRGEVELQKSALNQANKWRTELEGLVQSKENMSPHTQSEEVWDNHFESVASESEIQLGTRRSSPSKDKTKLNQIRTEASFQGSLEGAVKFLYLLLSDPSHPRIESCQLSLLKAGEDKLRGQITLSVQLKPATPK